MDGNHFNRTEKNRINISPSQKDGKEIPISDTMEIMESAIPFCRIAAITPRKSPSTIAAAMEHAVSFNVLGVQVRISVMTGCLVV